MTTLTTTTRDITVVFWLCVTATSVLLANATPTTTTINCSLDDDQTNPQLDNCLQQGEKFVENYEKALKRDRLFEHCQEYEAFGNCLRPMLQQCALINTTLHHKWKTILYTMDGICKPNCKECVEPLYCMSREYNSIYSMMCREMFDFNKEQGTHGKCRFIREKLDCEQSLIASACGEPVGHLFISLMKVNIKKEKCFVPQSHNRTKHFKYSAECPTNITQGLQTCAELNPRDTILNFMEDNNLVVNGKRKYIKKSCSHYGKYKSCENNLSRTCPQGVEKFLHFSGKQRLYQLKMDFICKENKKDYLDSVYCYQGIVKNNSFSKCNPEWDKLNNNLRKYTPYQYYCQPENHNITTVNKHIEKLQKCYENVISKPCGQVAATTMGKLIAKAFKDPIYLRWKFHPDCNLHKPDIQHTSTTATTTTTKTTDNNVNSSHIPNVINTRDNSIKNNHIKEVPKYRPVATGAATNHHSDGRLIQTVVLCFIWTIIYNILDVLR